MATKKKNVVDRYKLSLELMTLEEELKRRFREERLRYYNTGDKVHYKQLEFHKDNHRIRWMFGGNRTGKTVSGGVEAVWWARGNHPFKQEELKKRGATKGWVVSLTNEVQRDVAQKEVLKWLNPAWIKDIHVRQGRKDDPENAIIDFIVVESIHGGDSVIGFKSCDQGRGKFQGTSLDWVWFDEEPPKEIYEESYMRIIDKRGFVWGTMTPLMGLTWVYDVIYMNETGNPNIKYWMMEWADNPWLHRDEIAALESTMTEDEREARQYGKFVALSGLIYGEFREEIHVIDPFEVPKEWYDDVSIDPGLTAPLSAHFYAVDGDGNVYVIAEHYQAGKDIEWHSKRLFDKAKELNWPLVGGKLRVLMDSAAEQKTLAAQKSVKELFSEKGIIARTHVNKSVWSGIQRVKLFLKLRKGGGIDEAVWPKGKPKLFIFKTCPQMIKEIKSYRWKPQDDTRDDKTEEPIKKNDHAMDDLRYYIMSKPKPYEAGGSKLPDNLPADVREDLMKDPAALEHYLKTHGLL